MSRSAAARAEPAILSGTLDEFRLDEVLEAVGMSRSTLQVVLASDSDLVLRGGMVLAARKDTRTGREGFFAIFADPGPRYEVFASPGFPDAGGPVGALPSLIAEVRESRRAEVERPLLDGPADGESLRALLESLGLSRQVLRIDLATADRGVRGFLVVRAGHLHEAQTADGLEGAAALRALCADPGARFSVRITTTARRQPIGRLTNLFEERVEVPGYAVETLIGRGGTSVVWGGREVATGSEVAIKVLHMPREAAAMLVRELVAASRIRHPNIVELRDFGVLPSGEPYLVMERMVGHTLAQHLAQRGPLAVDRMLHLFDPVLEAMAQVHDAGLVHRDIKPSNLWMWDPDGAAETLVLLDFGIASRTGTDGTDRGFTPAYVPPEAMDGHEVAPSLDVYQLGLVMAEALLGAGLTSEDPYQAMVTHLAGIALPEPLRSSAVGTVLARAIAFEPAQRFPDAGALRAALAAVPRAPAAR